MNEQPVVDVNEVDKQMQAFWDSQKKRTAKQFHNQYKDQDIVLRGPVPLEAFLEWIVYAKSVTVSTPVIE